MNITPDSSFITCKVANSITTVLSNVTAFAKDLITDIFPDGYFSDIFIATASTSSLQANLKENEIPIIRYPQLSIAPIYYPNYDDVYGGPFPQWRRGSYIGYKDYYSGRYGYKTIFRNDDDDIKIFAIPQRIKLGFEYKIKTESHLKKIDLTNMLRQKFNEGDRMFFNKVLIEAQLPNTIVAAIAAIKNYNLADLADVETFLQYLRTYSPGNIVTKINNSTGNRMFAYLYSANILVSVESPPEADGRTKERINMADGEGLTELTLTAELWIPNNYMFECKTLPVGDYKPIEDESKVVIEHAFRVLPSRTIGDKSLIRFEKIITDVNKKIDSIDLEYLIHPNTLDVIRERIKAGDLQFCKDVFKIVVYRDERELVEGCEFLVNWDELRIDLINPLFNYVYNVGIYANQDILFNNVITNK